MNLKTAERYIDIARQIAMEQLDRPNRHISMIFKGSSLIGLGTNSKHRTHPLALKYGYLFQNMHSELAAWITCRHKNPTGKGLTLVNYHFNNQGRLKLSRPCSLCLSWSATLFDEIIYSTANGKFEKLRGLS